MAAFGVIPEDRDHGGVHVSGFYRSSCDWLRLVQ